MLSILFSILGFIGFKIADMILEKIFKPYIPERKKIISYIKKFFAFTFKYALPITALILFLTDFLPFDKLSVFGALLNVAALLFNFFMDTILRLSGNVVDVYKKMENLYETFVEMEEGHVEIHKGTRDMLDDIKKRLKKKLKK